MKRIAVIGGGAAGLAAAIAAAQELRGAAESAVSVYEMDPRVGRRILATGNGRCNFSNADVSAEVYNDPAFVGAAYELLPPSEVWQFFAGLGLTWTEENEVRLLPSAGKASVVLDVLRARAAALGVAEVCDAQVKELVAPATPQAPWTLVLADGRFERAEAVVVAAGGQDSLSFLPDAVATAPLRPMLGPLKTDTRLTKALDNIRVKCRVTLVRAGVPEATEAGELLFRKYGVSGICVFNLSRFAQPGDVLEIDLLPCRSRETLAKDLRQRLAGLLAYEPDARARDVFRGMLLNPVAEAVCKAAKVDAALPVSALTEKQSDALVRILKRFALKVEGVADPAQCQVHRGGVAVSQVTASLEHETLSGLFFAGEALDVDGPCGGYNLHWAWTSGLIAGKAAAGKLLAMAEQR